MTDDVPSELDPVAERVRRTLDAAAASLEHRESPPEAIGQGRPTGRPRPPWRRVLMVAAVVLLIAGLVGVMTNDDDSDGSVVTGEPETRPGLGEPLRDLGFPNDLLDDAGRVRALLAPGRPSASGGSPEQSPTEGGLGFDLQSEPTRIVVAVSDPDAARPRLEAAMSDPSRLEIRAFDMTVDEKRALHEEIDAEVGDAGNVLFGTSTVNEVELFPRQERLGAELILRHGPDIRVSVSGIPFPYTDTDACPAIPASVDSVRADVRVLTPKMTLESEGLATVTVENASELTVEVTEPQAGPGVWLGSLVEPGTSTVVAGPPSPYFSTGEGRIPVPLAPGESLTIGASIGRVACRVTPRTGTTLPPGEYELVVIIQGIDGQPASTPPAAIRIVDELPSAEQRAAYGPASERVEPEERAAELGDRFLAFAEQRTRGSYEAIPPSENVDIVGPTGSAGGVAGIYADPSRWPTTAGGENLLDLVAAMPVTETTAGAARWCTGPEQATMRFLGAEPDLTIEHAPVKSCDDWRAVSLVLDDAGRLAQIHVFVDDP